MWPQRIGELLILGRAFSVFFRVILVFWKRIPTRESLLAIYLCKKETFNFSSLNDLPHNQHLDYCTFELCHPPVSITTGVRFLTRRTTILKTYKEELPKYGSSLNAHYSILITPTLPFSFRLNNLYSLTLEHSINVGELGASHCSLPTYYH